MSLLRGLGVTVHYPLEQTCCGQMHVNTGYPREAIPLIGNFVEQFADASTIVTPSGSCAALIREYYPQLAQQYGDPALADACRKIAGRTFELTEFLYDALEVTDVGAYFPAAITYHPTCHSLRGLRLGDRPTRLLEAVEGGRLIDLPAAEECCGFGGTFALKNHDVSADMLSSKIDSIGATGAEFVVAADNSCLMHIGGGLSRLDSGVQVVHIAEVLASTRESPYPSFMSSSI